MTKKKSHGVSHAALTEALKYNPFDGDFGDVGDRELKDKIVTFRKARPCHCCAQDVKPGTTGRSLTMLWASDGPMSYAYCTDCTQAQADSWTDEGRALDARFALRSRAPKQLTAYHRPEGDR